MKGDMLQPAKRLAIGNSQTTAGDRLQPSLTASSMFNAAGQRGRAEPGLLPSWRGSAPESLAGRGMSVMLGEWRQETITGSVK